MTRLWLARSSFLWVVLLHTCGFASEESLEDPLQNFLSQSTQSQAKSAESIQSIDSAKSLASFSAPSALASKNYTNPAYPLTASQQTSNQGSQSTTQNINQNNSQNDSPQNDSLVAESTRAEDFQEVQRRFSWIRSVGLVIVSFDDGSLKSGFGVLLPDRIFLTSAELAHNASAYPKDIFLKMRDKSAGNLICVAQLHLKAIDKMEGLALFEISGYTDDYCNLRSQSYYHQYLFKHNALDILQANTPKTQDFYTVTTTFNNPNIRVLKIKEEKHAYLPIQESQNIVFGRPFFSQNGEFLGIATMNNQAVRPIIVSQAQVRHFICSMDKVVGYGISETITKRCR
ncbi:hypothetical protein [uncultured Helicobacter sp.]|uniref:hypothetical protein n=1 Tax=uncultured Helicobacter sp. TaxID=175537 RepID=UPI0025900CE7|nr:hypothetical protein [uncultured Helicobacter sp.]